LKAAPCISLGCESAPAPQIEQTTRKQDWTLHSRMDPSTRGTLPDPELLGIVTACTRACAAERWRTGEDQAIFLFLPRKVVLHQVPERWRAGTWRRHWGRLGPLLQACLGDPFRPAPGHTRILHEGPEPTWHLTFDAAGPCQLNGGLRLAAVSEEVDAGLLHVDGQPWSSGGKERAKLHLIAWYEAHGRAGELDEESRAWIEVALSQTPEPAK
jgi:hypothetical protein